MLGFNRIATISDYEKDKRYPDIETVCKMADFGSVSIEWLLTGRGQIFSFPAEQAKQGTDDAKSKQDDFVIVKVYDQSAAAPPAKFPDALSVDSLCISKNKFSANITAIKTNGMIAGIDKSDTAIENGKLYAVWLEAEGVVLRRIFVRQNALELCPEDRSLSSTTLPPDSRSEDFIIGAVRWIYIP